MAKTYRLSRGTRLINSVFRLTRLDLGASYRHILTAPGRRTGRLYSTPVDMIELDGQGWFVAGYIEADPRARVALGNGLRFNWRSGPPASAAVGRAC